MGRCENGHEAGLEDSYCSACGARVTEPDGTNRGDSERRHITLPPALPAMRPQGRSYGLLGRRRALFVTVAALVLVGAGLGLGIGLTRHSPGPKATSARSGLPQGGVSSTNPPSVIGATGLVQCSGGSGPKGTNPIRINLSVNTPTEIKISVVFDGSLPQYYPNPAAGDVRVTLTLYFSTGPGASDPYKVMLSQLFGIQAGRVGAGFIDSSGFQQQRSGNTWTLTFNPTVFTQLPAGHPISIGASVLVEQFVANGHSLGYFEIANQECPAN